MKAKSKQFISGTLTVWWELFLRNSPQPLALLWHRFFAKEATSGCLGTGDWRTDPAWLPRLPAELRPGREGSSRLRWSIPPEPWTCWPRCHGRSCGSAPENRSHRGIIEQVWDQGECKSDIEQFQNSTLVKAMKDRDATAVNMMVGTNITSAITIL